MNLFTTAARSVFTEVPVVQFDIDPSSRDRAMIPVSRSALADARLAAEALLTGLGTGRVASTTLSVIRRS